MSIYGCMLDYTLISAEMADEDLRSFIQKIGYIEAMPVVVDPGVLNPYEFIGAVINRRLPNPFMPDAPQRIATDTSQKLAIRFGETIKAYDKAVLIPLVLAGYARYLKCGRQPSRLRSDPLLVLGHRRSPGSALQLPEGASTTTASPSRSPAPGAAAAVSSWKTTARLPPSRSCSWGP